MPEEVHAIAFDTYALYAENDNHLPENAIEIINGRLMELSGNLQELWHALAGLGALALTFDVDDQAAATSIRDLIAKQAPHFQAVLEELKLEAGDGASETASAFNQMLGQGAVKSAPKHDEAAPEGSVSVKSFLPNPAGLRPAGAAPKATKAKESPTDVKPPARARRGKIDLTAPSGPDANPSKPGGSKP